MRIPEKYRERYDRLAMSHPWMREMRDEQPPEGDAAAILRKAASGFSGGTGIVTDNLKVLLKMDPSATSTSEAVNTLADMVERDYVSREKYDGLKVYRDTWENMARVLEAERDRMQEVIDDYEDSTTELEEMIAVLEGERDDALEIRDKACGDAATFKAERDEWRAKFTAAIGAIEEPSGWRDENRDLYLKVDRLEAERDEWKAKAEAKSTKRAAAVERLRNFESSDEGDGYYWDVTRALLGKRPTEYDNSDELISALIDLLTDDDEVTNLEWLFEHNYETLCDQMGGQPCSCCVVGCKEDLGSDEACAKALREWLMAPHSDQLSDSESSQRASESDQREQERACESYMEPVDAQRDSNGTCPDAMGQSSTHSKPQSKDAPTLSDLYGILSDEKLPETPVFVENPQKTPEHMQKDDEFADDREALDYYSDRYGEMDAEIVELRAEADYWKQEVQNCLDCAYPQSHSPERRYDPNVMGYPDRKNCTTPSTLVCAVIDGLRDEKGEQYVALFNDARRLECENKNLAVDLSECMEAKGALEDELRAVKRQLKQEQGMHSVTLNNWEQAKGKLKRERESLQEWKAKLDERDAKTAQEVADEQAAQYREKAEYWKARAEESWERLSAVKEAVAGVVDDMRALV